MRRIVALLLTALTTLTLLAASALVVRQWLVLRRLRAALQRAETRVLLAEQAKSQLVRNMSHELRTPLNAIIGFSEMMDAELMGPLSAIYQDYARTIGQAGQRLLSSVNDIMEMAAIDLGGEELAETVIDLSELATSVVGVVRGHAELGGITLSVQLSPNLPPLHGDGARIKRLLLNLVDNAITYNKRGGTVDIAAERTNDNRLVLSVHDTGIGVAAADIERIMAPFALGEDVFSRHHQGQGLGLTIAQHLCRLHGAVLSLTSTPDLGTTATVTFPTERVITQRLSPERLEQLVS